jgi:MYXO-CTERM domain-containing protein
MSRRRGVEVGVGASALLLAGLAPVKRVEAGAIVGVPVVAPACADLGGSATLELPNPFASPANVVRLEPVHPAACDGYDLAGFEPGPVGALGTATATASFTTANLGATACYYQAEFQRPDPEFPARVERRWAFVKFDTSQCVAAGFASANDASITCSVDGDLVPGSATFIGGSMASGTYAMLQPACDYTPLQSPTTFVGPLTWHVEVSPFTAAMPAAQRVGLPAGCVVSVDADDSTLDVPALLTHQGCSRSTYLSLDAALGNVPAGVAHAVTITNPLAAEVKDATLRLPQASGFAFAAPCSGDVCAMTVSPLGASADMVVERGPQSALMLFEHGDGYQLTGYGAHFAADGIALDVDATLDLGTAARDEAALERDVTVYSGEPITQIAVQSDGRIGLDMAALAAAGLACEAAAEWCVFSEPVEAAAGRALPVRCDASVGDLGQATAVLRATTRRHQTDEATYDLVLPLTCTLVPAGGGGDDPTDDASAEPISYYACASGGDGGAATLVAIVGGLVVRRRRRRR